MDTRQKRIRYTVGGLLLLVALMLGISFGLQMQQRDSYDFHGTRLQNPRPIMPFEFKGIDGASFTNQNLKGQWTFLFFGFSSCATVCPTTMATLGAMNKLLQADKTNAVAHVVMITIDPKRDRPKKLEKFVKTFDPTFYGARGKKALTQTLANSLGLMYEKIPDAKPQDAFLHSGAVVLVNPQGDVEAFYTPPLNAKHMAEDFIHVVS